jgi:hypothetical protein
MVVSILIKEQLQKNMNIENKAQQQHHEGSPEGIVGSIAGETGN